MSKSQHTFEELLAYHCAPTLKKQKPANMFHIQRSQLENLEEMINLYNKLLAEKGLRMRLFQADKERVTVYVYCPCLIRYFLSNKEVKDFLACMGYPNTSLEDNFAYLEYRLSLNEYPHEIGIFLGYPLVDVVGFLNHEPCICMVDRRVYKDAEKAKKIFSIFQNTRDQFVHAIENGQQILSLV